MLKTNSSKEFKDTDDNLILSINKKYDYDYYNDDISSLSRYFLRFSKIVLINLL